jgi:hypothetical protein
MTDKIKAKLMAHGVPADHCDRLAALPAAARKTVNWDVLLDTAVKNGPAAIAALPGLIAQIIAIFTPSVPQTP